MITTKHLVTCAALAGFVGIISGSLLMAYVLPSRPSTLPSSVDSEGLRSSHQLDSAVTEELKAIRALLETMGVDRPGSRLGQFDQVGSGRPSTSPERRPVDNDSTPDLQAIEAQLATIAKELRATARQVSNRQELILPTQPPAIDLHAWIGTEWEELNPLMQPDLLINYQQALDKYGKPNHAHTSGNNKFVWTYVREDGEELQLMFFDGLLFDWSR